MRWPRVQIRHVAQFHYGESLPAESRADGGVPVFGSNGQVGVHDRALSIGPTIVIGRKGSMGRLQYSSVPVFPIDTTYFIDVTVTRANLRWLYYALGAANLHTLGQDVGVPGLNRDSAYSQRIPLPPPVEQRAIADFLDAETARIDALIAKKRDLIRLSEERVAALTDLVIWSSDGTPTPLMHLVPARRQIMYGIVLPGPNVEDGVPIVKGGSVKAHRLKLGVLSRTTSEIDAGYTRSRLKAGDLVFAIRGGVGDVEIVPEEVAGANITQDVARVAASDAVSTRWLLHALRSPTTQADVASRVTGAAIRGINIWDLERVRVPVPSSEDQLRLSKRLDEATALHEHLALRLARQIGLLTERRQALITAAVTGELDLAGRIAEDIS